MTSVQITLNCLPLTWKAPLKGAHGFYSPRYEANKIVEAEIREAYKGDLMTGWLRLDVEFYMPMPKSFPKWKQWAAKEGLVFPVNGDRSNCLKYIEDRMQGIVYENDKKIVKGDSSMFYAESPRTVILLREVHVPTDEEIKKYFKGFAYRDIETVANRKMLL